MDISQRLGTQSVENSQSIKAHIFSTIQPEAFFRQSPGSNPTLNGVTFSVGLEVPEDSDVLFVAGRGSFSIPTILPRERTVFCEVEADAVNPRNTRFLNQFGIVVTSSEVELKTEKWQQNNFNGWFVGVDFSSQGIKYEKNHDWFANLKPSNNIDKISIVTSKKKPKKEAVLWKTITIYRGVNEFNSRSLGIIWEGFSYSRR